MIHLRKWEECSIINKLHCIDLFPFQEDNILRFLPLGFYLFFWWPYIFSKCCCLTTEISWTYAQDVIQGYGGKGQIMRPYRKFLSFMGFHSGLSTLLFSPLLFSLSPFPWLKSNLGQGWVPVYLSHGLCVINDQYILMNKWILRKQNMYKELLIQVGYLRKKQQTW